MQDGKIKDIITKQVEDAAFGTLFFSNSFPEYGDEYVGHILSDLAQNGDLSRLCRGVYLKAEKTRFGLVYPPIGQIAAAIAKRDNADILPTGATALNLLGLSTQVPMSAVYLTSGSARVIKIGERTLTFRRAVPRNFAVRGEKRRLIAQALKAIGEGHMTNDLLHEVRELLHKYPEEESLSEDLPVVPTWIRRIIVSTNKERQS